MVSHSSQVVSSSPGRTRSGAVHGRLRVDQLLIESFVRIRLFWSRTRLKRVGRPRARTETFKPDQFEMILV